eukprot:12494831-Alexandrium_andersonii.AAC.1
MPRVGTDARRPYSPPQLAPNSRIQRSKATAVPNTPPMMETPTMATAPPVPSARVCRRGRRRGTQQGDEEEAVEDDRASDDKGDEAGT